MIRVEKIIECSQRYGFIKAVRSSTAEKRPHWFHYGPAGEILVQNLQREWVYSTISARESTNVFQHCSPGPAKDVSRLKDAYEGCKYLTNGQLPFGLVENRTSDEQCEPEVPKKDCCEHLPKKCQPLIYYAFVSHQVGVQFFYRWQQHRLMWWRKFAMDPGRFSVTETGKEGRVDIQAKFSWGSTTLETIRNRGSEFFGNLPPQEQAHFEVMDGRKRGLPHVVESVCTIEAATFTYLCDGFSEFESKEQFHLHRRLAPFKISFAAAPTSSQGSEELTELSVYLGQELRSVGIITLLPQINSSLESQLARCDSLAVPYTLILTTATLVTGIAMLRSQQTSLVEEIHVSQVVSYVVQLMRNY